MENTLPQLGFNLFPFGETHTYPSLTGQNLQLNKTD